MADTIKLYTSQGQLVHVVLYENKAWMVAKHLYKFLYAHLVEHSTFYNLLHTLNTENEPDLVINCPEDVFQLLKWSGVIHTRSTRNILLVCVEDMPIIARLGHPFDELEIEHTWVKWQEVWSVVQAYKDVSFESETRCFHEAQAAACNKLAHDCHRS